MQVKHVAYQSQTGPSDVHAGHTSRQRSRREFNLHKAAGWRALRIGRAAAAAACRVRVSCAWYMRCMPLVSFHYFMKTGDSCCGAGAVAASAQPDVVLTRESGKNGEMAQRLRDRNIEVLELPLVETGEGPDRCVHAGILVQSPLCMRHS